MKQTNPNFSFYSDGRTVLPGGQKGAALAMALVILLILTILGVTAMSTSSLEQKMAGNIQDVTRAFQAAESGVDKTLDSNANGFDLSAGSITVCNPCTFDSGKSGQATVATSLIQITQKPHRSSTSSGYGSVSTANIDLVSQGQLGTGSYGRANYTVHQGVTQPAPAQN